MRDFDEMKLARVIDACGGIKGLVKMQKIVYLLQAMGYDLPFHDFRILQHGPFSREVACSADILTGPVLEEAQEPIGKDIGAILLHGSREHEGVDSGVLSDFGAAGETNSR